MTTIKHYHHHYHFSYTTTLRRQFSTTIVVLVGLILLFLIGFNFISPPSPITPSEFSPQVLFAASIATLSRLLIAYILSLIFSIPLALLITLTPKLERVLLPLFDILQSIPILAFFPIIVLLFIKLRFFNGAAIFVLFMAMLWNLVFTMIGGLKTIPEDVKDAALVFHATGVKKLFYITLPAIFPYIVTGSLLAWAQGWNILIVAEVLHNYIPNGTTSQDLIGLGSLMVNSTYQGQSLVFIASLTTMVVLIAVINLFVWQKLLHFTERFKFD